MTSVACAAGDFGRGRRGKPRRIAQIRVAARRFVQRGPRVVVIVQGVHLIVFGLRERVLRVADLDKRRHAVCVADARQPNDSTASESAWLATATRSRDCSRFRYAVRTSRFTPVHGLTAVGFGRGDIGAGLRDARPGHAAIIQRKTQRGHKRFRAGLRRKARRVGRILNADRQVQGGKLAAPRQLNALAGGGDLRVGFQYLRAVYATASCTTARYSGPSTLEGAIRSPEPRVVPVCRPTAAGRVESAGFLAARSGIGGHCVGRGPLICPVRLHRLALLSIVAGGRRDAGWVEHGVLAGQGQGRVYVQAQVAVERRPSALSTLVCATISCWRAFCTSVRARITSKRATVPAA